MSACQSIVNVLTRSTLLDDPAAVPVESIRLGSLYHIMMTPYVPLIGVAFYLSMVTIWERVNKQRRLQAAATGTRAVQRTNTGVNLKPFIIAHNVVLAVYSLWTFADYFPHVFHAVKGQGLTNGLCDSNSVLWSDRLLEHGFLFYLSKYYEFIDTAIILAKGREAGQLQTFHHSGAVLIMWLGNYTQSPYLSFFVFENSIIHALMYTYYTLTALGFKPPGKQMLTRMQISQFYIALSGGACYLALFRCQNTAQTLFTCVFMAYIVELIRLFTSFARKTYGAKETRGTLQKKNA